MSQSSSINHLRQQAEQCMGAGRLAEAINSYSRLLSLAPDDADSTYNLGWLWQQCHQPAKALAAYERALSLGIAGAEEVHLNRAVLLADSLARPREALEALRLAIELQPDYLDAWLNLGNLHEQLGSHQAAAEAYRTVLHLDPAHALALARLSSLSGASASQSALIERLRLALSQAGRSSLERADLGFALGKALDAVGDHELAFEAYRQANASSEAMPGCRPYDAQAHAQRISRIMAFDQQALPPLPAHDGPALIFICGMFRSGSSLTEQILASHPQVTPGGELDLLPRLAQVLQRHAAPPSVGELLSLRDQYLRALAQVHPGAQVVTDKRVDNFLHLGLIRSLFPSAKIVITERDPLDNGLALYFLHLGEGMPWARSLSHIGHWYGQYRRLMQHWHRLFGADLHTVRYEHLVQEPDTVIRALLTHCQLPWDSRCLRPQDTASQVKTPSAWQVRQPIYTHSMGRWRHYERQLAPLREALLASGALKP